MADVTCKSNQHYFVNPYKLRSDSNEKKSQIEKINGELESAKAEIEKEQLEKNTFEEQLKELSRPKLARIAE